MCSACIPLKKSTAHKIGFKVLVIVVGILWVRILFSCLLNSTVPTNLLP